MGEQRDQSSEPGRCLSLLVISVKRVIEEVVVGKESSTRAETVNDTVRGTNVEVERVVGENSQLRPDATTKKTQ